MKATLRVLLGMALVFAFVLTATAEDKEKKQVELKGQICCAKCELKVEGQKTCHTVIKVKEGEKEVVYWLDPESSKKNHKEICTQCKEGTVKGTVEEKDGKKWVKATKVEFKK
jgi:hypothetical protein